eukprot:1023708-Amphidinium_carterae.3
MMQSCFGVLLRLALKVLILKFPAIDALATCAILVREVTTSWIAHTRLNWTRLEAGSSLASKGTPNLGT